MFLRCLRQGRHDDGTAAVRGLHHRRALGDPRLRDAVRVVGRPGHGFDRRARADLLPARHERDRLPGDEAGNYTLNPGEAFAEVYRFSQAARVTDWPSIPLIVDASRRSDRSGRLRG
jgi:hypothetical protein